MVFRDILVPVDFTFNTDIAVKKAIELLDADQPVINLLHVISPLSDCRKLFRLLYQGITSQEPDRLWCEEDKLQQIRKQIIERMPVNGKVETSIMRGSVEQCIVQHAKAVKCELIILGKHNRQTIFPVFNQVSPNKIARSGNSAVLMAKPGSLDQKIRSIVVPVGKLIPRRKIELLVALLNKFHAKVHLVTLKRPGEIISDDSSQALLHTYRIIKGLKFSLPLEHKVIEGKNLANASLRYAQFILADMILVSPESETRVSTFTGQHITDLLLTNSRLQVLEVEP